VGLFPSRSGGCNTKRNVGFVKKGHRAVYPKSVTVGLSDSWFIYCLYIWRPMDRFSLTI